MTGHLFSGRKGWSRATIIRIVVSAWLAVLVLGPYIWRCMDVRKAIMAHEGIDDVAEYNEKVSLLLTPAFTGEMHWHVHLRQWKSHIICVHGWRQQTLDFPRDSVDWETSPGTPDDFYSSCRFSHAPRFYAPVDWVALEGEL